MRAAVDEHHLLAVPDQMGNVGTERLDAQALHATDLDYDHSSYLIALIPTPHQGFRGRQVANFPPAREARGGD